MRGSSIHRAFLALAIAASSVLYFPSAAQAAPLIPIECDGSGILTQANALWRVDMGSGQSTKTATLPTSVNGAGYNVKDGYVYVYDYPDTDGTAGIGRIGANGTYEYLGQPTGTYLSNGVPTAFTPMNFNIGEVTSDGHLWLSASGSVVLEIDVTSGSPTFMQIIASHPPVTRTGIGLSPDWAELAGQPGKLYAPMRDQKTNAMGLVVYDTATGVTTNLGTFSPTTTGLGFGAVYGAADGFLYGSDNNSGAIYRMDPANMTIAYFAAGPPSAVNDGAFCRGASIPVDFGDAPASYSTSLATNGPRHSVLGWKPDTKTADLSIGPGITIESDAPAAVDGDTDDAFATAPELVAGLGKNITVPTVNNTGAPATLAAWIDTDGDGTFNETPVTVTVPAGATSVALDLPAVAAAGQTWLRLRLVPGDTAPAATGGSVYGEVEDWAINVAAQNPHLTVTKAAGSASYAVNGESITYTITALNDGNVALADVGVNDPLCALQETRPGDLAPGESATFTCTYAVTQTDLDNGSIANTASATATSNGSSVGPFDASTSIDAVQQPAIAINNEIVSGSPYASAGDVITAQMTVTNPGNVTLNGVEVTNPFCTGPLTLVDDGDGDDMLAPGEQWVYTCTRTVTDADLGQASISSIASASGYGPMDDQVTASDEALAMRREVAVNAPAPSPPAAPPAVRAAPPLALTGAAIGGMGLLGVTIIGSGIALAAAGRRGRRS